VARADERSCECDERGEVGPKVFSGSAAKLEVEDIVREPLPTPMSGQYGL
jgi:hypothetical protein